jgi:hypothetical protein
MVLLVSRDASFLAAPQVGRAPAAPRARTAPATSLENSNFSEIGALRRASAVASSVAKRGAGSVQVVAAAAARASSDEAEAATWEEARRRARETSVLFVREALPTMPTAIGRPLVGEFTGFLAAVARAEVAKRKDCMVLSICRIKVGTRPVVDRGERGEAKG